MGAPEHQDEDFSRFKQQMQGVKALVDTGVKEIPSFYRQALHQHQDAVDDFDVKLPVIDLCEFDELHRPRIVQEVSKACQEWGFFEIINHGVASTVMENMLEDVNGFFDMPVEDRMIHYSNNLFERVRFGTSFNPDKESVLQWKDYLRHPCNPIEDWLPKWPSKPASYRTSAKAYAEAIRELALKLLELLSEGLGLPRQFLSQAFGEQHEQQMNSNYYPPCPNPELTIGISSHSDVGGLTLLLQNDVQGLEVLHDGVWIPVKPRKNALIVNLGDHSQVVSNGKYISVEHRAKVNSEKTRISIATFYQPSFDAETGPIAELLDSDHPPLYKSLKFRDYLSGFFSRELDSKRYLETLKLHNPKL